LNTESIRFNVKRKKMKLQRDEDMHFLRSGCAVA